MEWLPAASAEVVQLAAPADESATDEQSAVAPSLKVTVPVGTPTPPERLAVKVTLWPVVEGLTEDESVAVALAAFTCCTSAFDAAALYPASPE